MIPIIKSVPIAIPINNSFVKNLSNDMLFNTPPMPSKNSPNKLFMLNLIRRLEKPDNSIIDKR